MTPHSKSIHCVKISIGGMVQGVGFRPFVYRCAKRLGLVGTVYNDPTGVVVNACAPGDILTQFIVAIKTKAPPLAAISTFRVEETAEFKEYHDFTIAQSLLGESLTVDITRDSAVCDACLAEMRDPSNRRFRHPFINCTDCGPRYTIIKSLPYDRPATTMAGFAMCDECRAEYESPANRRFHAQPVCCHACGPKLSLLDAAGNFVDIRDPLREAVRLLEGGAIVAVKGIGGFHLACRADQPHAVQRLRFRKLREEKPLAVMVASLEIAHTLAHISDSEQALLESVERPIVILDKKQPCGVAPEVAPGVPTLGIMLPYAPLHHLLFDGAGYPALVMTSGNQTDEPICRTNDEAVQRLSGIADAFLVHNREIHMRSDDSIVRSLADQPVILRRGRGYVPEPLRIDGGVDGIVGLGGILKSTVAVGRGEMCYVSQYLGTLDNIETIAYREDVVRHLIDILGVRPTVCAADLHPSSRTSDFLDNMGIPVEAVQHHHAHAAACMAENGLAGRAVCIVYDGAGQGDDGCVWGGEALIGDSARFTRFGHLSYMPMPGGDAATINPGRMAFGALYPSIGRDVARVSTWLDESDKRIVLEVLRSGVNCPLTSSMGRLFDALSAMLGICRKRSYEGQPAIMLEGVSSAVEEEEYSVTIDGSSGTLVADGGGILMQAWEDFTSGTSVAMVGGRFHNTIARLTALLAAAASEAAETDIVCLSGGCFQNALLLAKTKQALQEAGLRPVCHRRLAPNDECISFGQVAVVSARRREIF